MNHPRDCIRCGGVWGEDLTCPNCTLPSGEIRPSVYHRPDCTGEPRCDGCGWPDQFGNWIPGPDTGWVQYR